MSRKQFDNEVQKIVIPDAVYATRSGGKKSSWKKGDDRNPADTEWWMSEQNPHVLEKTPYIARFDTAIAPNMSLSDDEFLADALTKRIFVADGLEFGIRGDRVSPATMSNSCEKIDWIFRYKWAERIERFEFATKVHFETLFDSLANGLLSLVPIDSRLRTYLLDVVNGTSRDCIYYTKRSAHVLWKEFSRELGVTVSSLRDPEFRVEFFDQVASFYPKVGKDLSESIILEKKRAPTSVSAYEDYLGVVSDLYRLSLNGRLNHDRLIIDPLGGSSVKKYAKTLGRKRNRTPTLPPQFLLQLMDHAVVWVFTYAEWIMKAVAETKKLEELPENRRPAARENLEIQLNAIRPNGAPKVWPSWARDIRYSAHFILPDLIQLLLLACAILISGFGARRLNETLNIKKGCIIKRMPGIFDLTIYIEKTLQDIDKIPVPEMVAGVVEVLEMLTEPSRGFTGNDWLFEVIRKAGLGDRYQRTSNLKNTFKAFTDFHQIEAPLGLDNWQLASHQLRRGFAICFYYGFECKDLDALSWFLRHFDPEMTRIYIRTVLPGQMAKLQREMDQRKAQMLGTITDEEDGWFKAMEKQYRDLKDRGEVWEAERQGAIVYRLLTLYKRTDRAVGKGISKLSESMNVLVQRASARVRIGGRSNSEEVFDEALLLEFKNFAKENVLDPVPGGHHHCSYGKGVGDMDDAECLKLERLYLRTSLNSGVDITHGKPNLLFSGLHPCLVCIYGLRFGKNVTAAETKMDELKTAAASSGSIEVQQSAQSTLEELMALTEEANRSVGDLVW